MTDLKHAFRVDVSPIIKACALLARESWDTDCPASREHWRRAADEARRNADAMANELSRLRQLEVKCTRFAVLLDVWTELGNPCAESLQRAMEAPLSEADLECFRGLMKP